MTKDKSNFFGNFLGSVSSLSFYAAVPQRRHPLVVLHLLVLSSVVLAVTLIPFASRMTAVAKRYVSYYDERFPEIHIE
ncbi:MAG: hypothetical protein H5U38_15175, partial [Calditrichaeota bacterium]|nr:hypothetical protein [Calditrichota bacterium]